MTVTKSDINKAFGAICAVDDAMRARHEKERAALSQLSAEMLSLRRRCVLMKDPISDDAAQTIDAVNALVATETERSQ